MTQGGWPTATWECALDRRCSWYSDFLAVDTSHVCILVRGARRLAAVRPDINDRFQELLVAHGCGGQPDRAPLKLLADGTLVAIRGEDEVPYAQFSGGEKVMSSLVLRLLALSMTTATPFLWLDEPLEHLDPRNRRMVASLLVKASTGGAGQIVATTYEEAVARRLDEADAAQLVYVESDPVERR